MLVWPFQWVGSVEGGEGKGRGCREGEGNSWWQDNSRKRIGKVNGRWELRPQFPPNIETTFNPTKVSIYVLASIWKVFESFK